MKHKDAPPGTQSVLRAIALLKAFTMDRPERDLSELADEVGLSRTTAHRLLAALESEGLISKNEERNTYRLGPEAIALGTRALRVSDLSSVARPHLESLTARTGETSTLEILSGGRMLILDEVLGEHRVGASPSVGSAWAIHATSTGKALLAALPGGRWKELLTTPLARFTPRTLTDLDSLEAAIEAIRQHGYATAIEELEEGFVAVGAAVRGAQGEPVASLSVGGPAVRLRRPRLPELGKNVVEAVRDLSRRLGARESS